MRTRVHVCGRSSAVLNETLGQAMRNLLWREFTQQVYLYSLYFHMVMSSMHSVVCLSMYSIYNVRSSLSGSYMVFIECHPDKSDISVLASAFDKFVKEGSGDEAECPAIGLAEDESPSDVLRIGISSWECLKRHFVDLASFTV